MAGVLILVEGVLIAVVDNLIFVIVVVYSIFSLGIAVGVISSKAAIKIYVTRDTLQIGIAFLVIFSLGSNGLGGIVVNIFSELVSNEYWHYRSSFLASAGLAIISILICFYLICTGTYNSRESLKDNYLDLFKESIKEKRF